MSSPPNGLYFFAPQLNLNTGEGMPSIIMTGSQIKLQSLTCASLSGVPGQIRIYGKNADSDVRFFYQLCSLPSHVHQLRTNNHYHALKLKNFFPFFPHNRRNFLIMASSQFFFGLAEHFPPAKSQIISMISHSGLLWTVPEPHQRVVKLLHINLGKTSLLLIFCKLFPLLDIVQAPVAISEKKRRESLNGSFLLTMVLFMTFYSAVGLHTGDPCKLVYCIRYLP